MKDQKKKKSLLTGSAIIRKVLKDSKNTTLFGYPGGAIMPFFDEIFGDKQIKLILMRHEQSAGHAAEGYAAASGKLGVCVSTSGPGATNLITALANAFYDSAPVLAFSGQVATHLIGNDAFQEADLIGATMAVTKHNYLVKDTRDLGRVFKEAMHIATTGRPGPVFIDLPKNVQLEECPLQEPIPEKINLVGYNPNLYSRAAGRQIQHALEMVMKARYPVILAGGGVSISNAYKQLTELVDMLKIPVVNTIKAKGVIDDYHPYALGAIGMHGRPRSNFAVSEADVLLAIGSRFTDRITGDLKKYPGQANAKIIHIDVDAAEIGKNVPVDLPIVADAKLALSEMNRQLKVLLAEKKKLTTNSWWYRWIKELKENDGIPDIIEKGPGKGIYPEKIMYELDRILRPRDIVVTEVGQHQMYAAHYLKFRNPRTFITSGGLGTMGYGFPAAIGAKIAKPRSEVWLIAGDGSIQMNSHELATVKQHDIKVNIIILNNGYLGMVRQWQELFHEGRYAGTELGFVRNGKQEYWPDFVKLGEAYGLKGRRVSDPRKVIDALEEAKASKETFVIEIVTERESNVLPMLPPGGALNTLYSRQGEHKSIYDYFRRLPRTERELQEFKSVKISQKK
ncbi:MAG: biosynthetic-type acetolactate synthase large subunit [Deltaproteobacteria bacterium]|jgi:acetolactate synthase I/II/III large subunit|nr:biosynthetic-type acetolactate synthase large subunit [Deltaproteobacteria bacterium]MBT4269159.1 biosynthetic-type acetolactate synthase large subunit [Deltaproteobacteria bacterium]MBT4639074.1 biosynthetic-type acetolactate synthase large subunit [Deltaproteobacteria bacterium]MBT6502880.1 biosynthetic-type acetolactate synthase large subunit [Deltaproteobacteria bacterium]MBT7154663.1 biosynthetic-type acetolactate synthase large subunit [Deltaproteobacteria bacterium]